MRVLRIAFVCLAAAQGQAAVAADTSEKPADFEKSKLKFEGRVSIGAKAEEFKNGESYYDAKLEFETKRRAGTRAVASFVGKSKNTNVVVEDTYLDHKFSDNDQVLFGQTKKRLGTEYMEADAERLTIQRSPIYRKLEEFAYVGREITARYEHPASGDNLGYAFTLGYAESLDLNTTVQVTKPLGDHWYAGTWLLLQSDRIDAGRQIVYNQFLSLWTQQEAHRWQAELVYGKDPYESEFNKTFGDNRAVHYAGLKTQYGYRISTGKDDSFEPLIQLSAIAHDLKSPAYNTFQALVGCNWYLDPALRIALNIEGLGTNSKLDHDDREYKASNGRIEATYYF